MGEISRRLNAGSISIVQCPITPSQLSDLIKSLAIGQINRNGAKILFDRLWPENVTVQLTGLTMNAQIGNVTALIESLGLKPLARFVSYAAKGVPPHIMGIGPIEAIPAALRYAGLKQDDIDWFELNEAFAAQSLAVINTLGLNAAKVNPMGGAIALGHPLGATGAIRAATVIHALARHQLKYGMVTMCVGMGQGAAGIFERV